MAEYNGDEEVVARVEWRVEERGDSFRHLWKGDLGADDHSPVAQQGL